MLALRAQGVRRVAVATYLLAPGTFADKIREACAAADASVVSGVLGAAPEVAEVVLARYAATASVRERSSTVMAVSGRPTPA